MLFFHIGGNSIFSQAPPWKWAVNTSGSGTEDIRGIAVDESSGEIVVVGELNGLTPEYPSISTLFGGRDGFVAKYDSANGSVIWAFHIGNANNEFVTGVSIDPIGNIFITGIFRGNNAEFRGVSGPSTTISSNGGSDDVFVAKYNSAGQLLWVRSNSVGNGGDKGLAIHANASSIVVTGTYDGPSGIQFGGWSSSANGTSADVFLVSYDQAGNILWGVDGTCGDVSQGNALDHTGSEVVLSGLFSNNSITFYDNNGLASLPVLTNTGNEDIFLLSVSNTGLLNWREKISGPADERVGGLAILGPDVYVTGGIDSGSTFPGLSGSFGSGITQDFFVSRHAIASGNTVWAEVIPSPGGDAYGTGIDGYRSGSLAVVGNVEGNLILSGYGWPNINGTGNDIEVAFLSIDASQNFLWAKEGTGNGDITVSGVDAFTSSGAIATAGGYEGTMDLDAFNFTDGPQNDTWVGFLDPCGVGNNNMPPDQTICSGTTPGFLNASVPSGGIGVINYLWEESSDNISFSPAAGTNNQEDYTFPGPLVNTMYYRRLVSSSGCPSDTNTSSIVTIFVDQAPTLANAGIDQTICLDVSTLFGNTPIVGSGNWALFSGSGVPMNPGQDTTVVTGLLVGANQFIWTISNGVCPPSTDTITIDVVAIPPISVAGPDQNICDTFSTFAGNNPTVGSGIWNLVSGSGIPTNPTQFNSAVTGLSVGNNSFEWVVSSGACGTESDTLEIFVDDPPSPAYAGPDHTICDTVSTFQATPPVIGTGNWSLLSGNGVPTSPSLANSAVTGLAVGANVFVWTVSNGTCTDTTDTIIITVLPIPPMAVAGPDQQICASTTFLAANDPSPASGTWTQILGSGTITNPTSFSSSLTGLGSGTNTFVWTNSIGLCPVTTDTIDVIVDDPPSPAVAGPDETICDTVSTFQATPPVIGTGNWSLLSGSGVPTSPSQANSAVTGLAVGTNEFVWTVSNGTCTDRTDTVSITVLAIPPAAAAGADQQICSATATLAGNNPNPATGSWTQILGTGTITNPTSFSSGLTALGSGTNTFVWTITNGICPATTDTVEIIVDDPPSPAVAGPDETICDTVSTFQATPPVIGTGNWSLLSGSGVPTSPSQANSFVTGLAVGTNEFVWTVSNGTCTDTTDTVSITVLAIPPASAAGTDQQICSATATLAGNNPNPATGSWTQILGTGTITNPTSFSSGLTALGSGTNTFVWTITNGICPATTDTVEIIVDDPPSPAVAGPDETICDTVSTFQATPPVIGTGNWSLLSGSGVPTSPSLANSGVTGLAVGVNVFVWTVSNGICTDTTDTVSITVLAIPPAAAAGTDQQICSDSVILAGNGPVPGQGTWTQIQGSGTIANPFSSSTTVNGLAPGTNTFVWTITNGICNVTTDTVDVIVDAPPSPAVAGPDETICDTVSTFQATPPVIGTGNWSLLSGSGVPTSPSQANSAVTGLAVGANEFVWTVSNGTCADTTDTVRITVLAIPPAAAAGADQQICSDSTSLAGNDPSPATGSWTQIQGNGSISNPTSFTSNLSGLTTGTNTFVWTITNGTCPATTDTVEILVDAQPSLANAGIDQTICDTTAQLNAVSPGIGIGTWTLALGTGVFNDPGQSNTGITGLSLGSNVLIWTVSNGVCSTSSDSIVLSVMAFPSATDAGLDQQICNRSAQLQAMNPVPAIGTWSQINGTGNFTDINQYDSGITDLSEGLNTLVWTTDDGVCHPQDDTVEIWVDLPPDVSNAGPDQIVSESEVGLSANSPLIGTGMWMVQTGNATFLNPDDPQTMINITGEDSIVLVWTISNGVCPSSEDQVVIAFSDLLIPTGFSPNGDGRNDAFVVRGLSNREPVKLIVRNRWGQLVYRSENYQNDWQGRNRQGNQLADDTYYIIVESGTFSHAGYVVIKR